MSYRQFTYQQIAKTFEYEAATGKLFRKLKSGRLKELMAVSESDDRVYVCTVMFGGHSIVSTHVMFMLMTRRWPKEAMTMDHRDGDLYNMKWSNLREETRQQQAWNRETVRWKGIKDGLERGVYKYGRKYWVRLKISVDGEQKNFGSFTSKEEANALARKIIAEVQGEYSFAASRDEDQSC